MGLMVWCTLAGSDKNLIRRDTARGLSIRRAGFA